jgi:hypothetical protein
MDIVIVANFCRDFSQKDNGRFKYLADILCKNNEVEIITSSFFHATKKQRNEIINNKTYKVTFIREPGYKKNVCLKRFYSHYIWGKGVEQYIRSRKTPDVVYCAVPSLTGAMKMAKYCKNKNIKFIIDVLDLWPEAFQMVFNIPIIKELLFLPFKLMADKIYKGANSVCAVSQTYIDRVKKVNSKSKIYSSVFLGTNLETFDEYTMVSPILKHKDGEIWIAYCGTLGKSYDLKCVIDALNKINNKSVRLIVMGDGPQEKEFKKYARDKKAKVSFLGRVDYEKVCAQLKECDITVNPIVGKSVASIINKHADYAASGLPVLNTQNSLEYIKLIEEYNMGFTAKSGDADDLAKKMLKLINDVGLRKKMGENARRCAKECFDRRYTYSKLVEIITGDIYK